MAILPGEPLLPHFIDRETETQRKEITSRGHAADALVLELRERPAFLPPDPVVQSMAGGLGLLGESPIPGKPTDEMGRGLIRAVNRIERPGSAMQPTALVPKW